MVLIPSPELSRTSKVELSSIIAKILLAEFFAF